MMCVLKIAYNKKAEGSSRNKSVFLNFDWLLIADFTEVLKD
jgi:hypothetical protein